MLASTRGCLHLPVDACIYPWMLASTRGCLHLHPDTSLFNDPILQAQVRHAVVAQHPDLLLWNHLPLTAFTACRRPTSPQPAHKATTSRSPFRTRERPIRPRANLARGFQPLSSTISRRLDPLAAPFIVPNTSRRRADRHARPAASWSRVGQASSLSDLAGHLQGRVPAHAGTIHDVSPLDRGKHDVFRFQRRVSRLTTLVARRFQHRKSRSRRRKSRSTPVARRSRRRERRPTRLVPREGS